MRTFDIIQPPDEASLRRSFAASVVSRSGFDITIVPRLDELSKRRGDPEDEIVAIFTQEKSDDIPERPFILMGSVAINGADFFARIEVSEEAREEGGGGLRLFVRDGVAQNREN